MAQHNGPGRPSSYRPEFCEQAEKLCRLGAIDRELADFFGVHEDTINAWKLAHPEFSASLKSGKEIADAEVADKLYRRACGYEHEAVKIFADAKSGTEHVVSYIERYPPDTTACIFWLKNRRPDLWRDMQSKELTGKDGGPISTTVEDARQEAERRKAAAVAAIDAAFAEVRAESAANASGPVQ